VPEHRLHLEAVQRLPGRLRLRARFTWQDAFPVDDANTASDWSHRVVDLRLRREAGDGGWSVRPFVGVDNLFDERYNGSVVPNAFGGRFFEPAPGRQLFGGASLTLPSL
jgi:iron complex outermembrane receptor protein